MIFIVILIMVCDTSCNAGQDELIGAICGFSPNASYDTSRSADCGTGCSAGCGVICDL